ncbi:Uncharacterized conserved protein [Ceraceosorus bombacis]|uniref:Uncharacterized conserved protein n=1 Tax=Ceraceosorus bombacis TaxID=401625 RepID=A0A0P1BCD5_9BASI|nr:Uncharacterized conserved protein [Ceraceosorus bombacis]
MSDAITSNAHDVEGNKEKSLPGGSSPATPTEGIIESDAQAYSQRGAWSKVRSAYGLGMTQVALVGCSCLLCPGMFNALGGIGGGGQVDPSASSNANAALYSCFAFVSFFGGSIHNTLGTRLCLFIGACGYPLYIASFLSYNHNQNRGFVIAAGAILGICASLFWTAQGAIMLSYPTEQQKGTAFAIVWLLLNIGGVLGSAIELGISYDSTADSLGDAVYAVFLVLTFLGACSTLLLKPPSTVVRADGTNVIVPKGRDWRKEIKGVVMLLFKDPTILLLFPLFLSSNFTYTWQQQMYIARRFTLRARSLGSMLYWLAQMVAAYMFSFLLDSKRLTRRVRLMVSWVVVFVFVWVVFGACYHVQLGVTRANTDPNNPDRIPLVDLNTSAFAGGATLYFWCGFMDALIQGFAYAIMGAYSNKMAVLASLAGFYKGVQSAGAAAGFGMDSAATGLMTTLATTWGLCAGALLIMLPVLFYRITNHTTDEEEEREQINEETGANLPQPGDREGKQAKEALGQVKEEKHAGNLINDPAPVYQA